MISSDRKAKVIVDLLRGLSEKDDAYDKNKRLESCLKAAAMIRLEIKGMDINPVKVSRLAESAKNAIFSLVASWEEDL